MDPELNAANATPALTISEARMMANVLDMHRSGLLSVVHSVTQGINTGTSASMIKNKLEVARKEVGKFLAEKSQEIERFAQAHPDKLVMITTVVILALVSGPILVALLEAVGFTASGVAAGSLAAAWQSSIGNVAAGSFFSLLQSITATGAAFFIGEGIGISLAALGVIWDGIKRGGQKVIDGVKDGIGHLPVHSSGNALRPPLAGFGRWKGC